MWSDRRGYVGVGTIGAGSTTRGGPIIVIARILDLLFSALYTVLAIRLVLDFFEARKDTGFYEFIASVTNPFYGPFRGIVHTNVALDSHPIVWSLIVAIAAYMVLHAGLRALLHVCTRSV